MPNDSWNPLLKSYPYSEKVNAVSVGAETLFTRLIAQADDYGNYYGTPRMILACLYPHRWAAKTVTETDVGRWRTELVTCPYGPLAALYSVNGSEYLHLFNPRRRFRSDVKPDERFPREPKDIEQKALSEHVTNAGRARDENVPLDQDKTKTKTEKKQAARFDEFWSVYPRKAGKQKARESFTRAVTSENFEAVMEGLRRHLDCQQWAKDGGQFIPYPATWLNQGRWEDEPDPRTNGDHRHPGTSRGKGYYLQKTGARGGSNG